MQVKGKIHVWNDDKGYGFILPMGGGPRVFMHISAVKGRNRRPAVDDIVTYEITQDKQGRIRAANATLAGNKLVSTLRRGKARPAIFLSIAFLLAVGMSVMVTGLPPLILVTYIAVSVITFFAYALDKSAAKNGRWRTKEGTLHFLALAGGWPGAWIAQNTLRHKSKKTEFRVVFWVTVLLNCVGLAWLHTSAGQAELGRLLGIT